MTHQISLARLLSSHLRANQLQSRQRQRPPPTMD
jgi:hypothetical protein